MKSFVNKHISLTKYYRWIVSVILFFSFFSFSSASGIEKIPPSPVAVELINAFMQALTLEQPAERMAAVVKFVHKSLLEPDGKKLDWDTSNFSYKKACQNVRFYKIPVEITSVHKGRTLTVGYGSTAEKGRIDKYFINKKPGQPGMPAPVSVFWPESGGTPGIIDMGSL